jgi:hypothetical protein
MRRSVALVAEQPHPFHARSAEIAFPEIEVMGFAEASRPAAAPVWQRSF